jgi:NADP-dependent 3-hydroxy acid dehydrogenase YdfG
MTDVAVITGAAGGIGSAVAVRLFAEGYSLGLIDVDMPPGGSDRRLCLRCDVTKCEEVRNAIQEVLARFGKIDVLVNCAGRSHLGTIDQLTLDDLDQVYSVNVRGTFNVTKAVLPHMRERRSGYIINMGSMRGLECSAGKAAYCVSKFAVRAFSKVLGLEAREHGVKVTVINPGFVQTPLIRHRVEEEGLRPADLTQPEDIARTVVYLLGLSPGASVDELALGRLW